LFKKILIILTLLPQVSVSQELDIDWENEIQSILNDFNVAFNKDITQGTRVYILALKKDLNTPAYCKYRIQTSMASGFANSKFEVVFQPFLSEQTLKRVESTDTSFRMINESSYKKEFKNMRSLMDSLKEYNIDLLLSGSVFLSPSNHLVLSVSLVEINSLETKTSYVFYGDDSDKSKPRGTEIIFSVMHGLSRDSEIARIYGTSQAQTIGPNKELSNVDAIQLGVYQRVFRTMNWLSSGIFISGENHYVRDFDDYLYNINDFQIRSLSISGALSFNLSPPSPDRNPSASIVLAAGAGKTTLRETHYIFSGMTRINLTNWLGAQFGLRYLTPVRITYPYEQQIKYLNTQLCAGLLLHI
tara:strand:- start:1508 stop:2581 length:1074 start_codon:yes stop_codon:yes gene_type:complete